jgi:hypothetical protein
MLAIGIRGCRSHGSPGKCGIGLQRKAKVDCRREAREDFDSESGHQLNEEVETILTDAKRPWRQRLLTIQTPGTSRLPTG